MLFELDEYQMSADEVWEKIPNIKFNKNKKEKKTRKELKELKDLMFPILFKDNEKTYAEVVSPDGKYVVTRNVHEGREGKFVGYNIYTQKTFAIYKWHRNKVKSLVGKE